MSVSNSEPLELFLYAMKSSETRDRYQRRLGNFFDYLELKGDLATQCKLFIVQSKKNGNNWVSASVMKFMAYHKERAERGEITYGTIRNYYKPLKLFLEMNEIELPWKKITRGLPKGRKHAADRAPTVEEIQKLVEYPDRRIKAIVFTMCSSGIRLGAWDYLKWSNILPIKENNKVIAAKIVVYFGDEEQYNSFLSPEAYLELKKWMDFRADAGEKISDNSWLMRDLWNIEKFAKGLVTVPKQLSSLGIKRLIERALYAQGIRQKLPVGQKRHEFKADHGFRKFFKTHSEQIMKPINVETLMGHSTGISDSYYRPNETELLNDYLHAVPLLTISNENLVSDENLRLKKHGEELETTKKQVGDLRVDMKELERKIQKLSVEKFFKQTEIDLRKSIPKFKADKMLKGYEEDLNNPKFMEIMMAMEKFMNLLGTGMEDVLESEDYKNQKAVNFKDLLETKESKKK